MTKGGKRPGAGRKPRPDDKMIRVAISLTPEQYDWLSKRPEGMAVTVRYFILQAMAEERHAGHVLSLEQIHEEPWNLLRRAGVANSKIVDALMVVASSSASPSPSPAAG